MDEDQVEKEIMIEARVPLDGHTIELRNVALAEASAALRKLKAEEKFRAKCARKIIADKDVIVARLEETVNTASEMGMIAGVERWDYDRWQVDTIRKDTGEKVSTRAMSSEERTAWKNPDLLEIDLPADAEPKVNGNATRSGSGQILHRTTTNKRPRRALKAVE